MLFKPKSGIITSVSELSEIIQGLQTERGINNALGNGLNFEMFRGQGNENWELVPALCRNVKDPQDLQRIEKAIILDFHNELVLAGKSKRLQDGFLNGNHHGDWLLIQQAQHYGLPTRFMDWTIKWEIALYFAVADSMNDEVNGEFWIYIVPNEKLLIDNEEAKYRNEDPFTYNEAMFLNSASFSSSDYLSQIAINRKNMQFGRFLVQSYSDVLIPLQDNSLHLNNMTKITIPHFAKKSIREELKKSGFTSDQLFIENDPFIEVLNAKLISKYGV